MAGDDDIKDYLEFMTLTPDPVPPEVLARVRTRVFGDNHIYYLREQAMPQLRRESDLDWAYRIVTPIREFDDGDQIEIQPMRRSGDNWVDDPQQKLRTVRCDEVISLQQLFELVKLRRDR